MTDSPSRGRHAADPAPQRPSVVVVGGGYAGVTVARGLDAIADVTLVEPKDHFVHAAGALRTAVDDAWDDKVFHSYDRVLTHGRLVRDTARLVTPTQVRLSPTEVIDADYLVLATGTSYPFPAKFLESHAWVARSRLARLRESLAVARGVMIVGAGPVGLELAGEIVHAFPHAKVTVVEKESTILPSAEYLPELRVELRAQLEADGVRFVLGAPLGYWPPEDVGVLHDFTVATTAGEQIDAQIWFRCFGNAQESDYLDAALSAARRGTDEIAVEPTMQVRGFDTVFAVGDVTDVPESKRAQRAIAHAQVAVANITAMIEGREPTATYAPAREQIVLPLGPTGGASQIEQEDGTRVVLGAAETSRIKGADLLTGPVRAMLGLD